MAVATPIGSRTDSEIHQAVIHEIKWDSRVKETEVGVEVHSGVVTLDGAVDTYAEKVAAEKAAHRVMGVMDVANDIRVKPAGAGAPDDTEIALAVREMLKWNVYVPERHITSTVSNGWVTLQGEVPLWSQRYDAEKAVSRIRGVRGVSNRIDLVPIEIDPMMVREKIEKALERQAVQEAKRIKVELVDGTLRLSGTVRTWDDLTAVRRAASHAPGVQRVEEDLRIDPYV